MIHALSAPKSTNEVTSKASLTQMINLIFSRMERFSTTHFKPSGELSHDADGKRSAAVSDQEQSLEKMVQENASENPNSEINLKSTLGHANEENSIIESADANITSDDEQAKIENLEKLKREVRMTLRFLCVYGVSTDSTVIQTFDATIAFDITTMNELSAPCTKDRTLALELILSVFNNLGPVFRDDEKYFSIIQANVCVVILRNSVTADPTLFEWSISIFLLIIRFYRHKLKMEVENQFKIYLQILEMGNSTYKQKSNILQALLKICENAQVFEVDKTLVDLYWNYDCDFEMSSIYEKIVALCSRITQGRID